MKAAARLVFLVIALTSVGMGVAAPMADVAAASHLQPRTATHLQPRTATLLQPRTATLLQPRGTDSFSLRDGARYKLGSRVGLFVDYKEMRPASGALSPLETGLRAMPPVRLGRFLVSAEIRVYFN